MRREVLLSADLLHGGGVDVLRVRRVRARVRVGLGARRGRAGPGACVRGALPAARPVPAQRRRALRGVCGGRALQHM